MKHRPVDQTLIDDLCREFAVKRQYIPHVLSCIGRQEAIGIERKTITSLRRTTPLWFNNTNEEEQQ